MNSSDKPRRTSPASAPDWYRPGALGVYDKNLGCWRIANPHDLSFSTLSLIATHFFNGCTWQAIEVVASSSDEPAVKPSDSVDTFF